MCEEDALYDNACPGYWEEIAFLESMEEDEDMDGSGYTDEEMDMYGFDEDFEAQS